MKVYKRITFPTWLLMGLKSSTCLEKHQFQEILASQDGTFHYEESLSETGLQAGRNTFSLLFVKQLYCEFGRCGPARWQFAAVAWS